LLLGVTFWKGGIMYTLNFQPWAVIFGWPRLSWAWCVTIVSFLVRFHAHPDN